METDHFDIIYGSKIWDSLEDIEDEEEKAEIYMEELDNFWDGFINGLKDRKIDIFKIAEEVFKSRRKIEK